MTLPGLCYYCHGTGPSAAAVLRASNYQYSVMSHRTGFDFSFSGLFLLLLLDTVHMKYQTIFGPFSEQMETVSPGPFLCQLLNTLSLFLSCSNLWLLGVRCCGMTTVGYGMAEQILRA